MRNTMLIVVITVIATLAIDRVVPIALAQTNPSSNNYFSDATCGVLRDIALAVELDGSTWEAAKKEPIAGQLAEALRTEGCARTIEQGGR